MDTETIKSDNHIPFHKGLVVQIRSETPIYKGPYASEVLHAVGDVLHISMPYEAGRLVFIPVGTEIVLSSKVHEDVRAIIVDRTGGDERSLQVKLSDATTEEIHSDDNQEPTVPIVAVTSGKGGVGKSTFAINLAIALQKMGQRVCIVDADLGTANIDVLLNLSPPFNLGHVIRGQRHTVDVLVEGPHGIVVLPGGSVLREITELSEDAFAELTDQFYKLHEYADVILLDTSSGVTQNVTHFVAASSAAILVTSPEPHAVTDAYALLRVLAEQNKHVPIHLVVNRIQGIDEGVQTRERIIYAARRFLQYEVTGLGHIREDVAVRRAVRQQVSFVEQYNRAKATSDMHRIAEAFMQQLDSDPVYIQESKESGTFLQRLRSLLKTS